MKTLFFRLSTNLKCLKRHRLLNFVVLLSMIVSLFMPLVILSAYEYSHLSDELFRKSAEKFDYKYIFSTDSLDYYDIRSRLNLEDYVDHPVISCFKVMTPMKVKGKYILTHIQGINEGYQNGSYKMVGGRFPTEEELENRARVALVDLMTMYRNGLSIGDQVILSGEQFTIIGSIVYPELEGQFMIPFKTFIELVPRDRFQVKILLDYKEKNSDFTKKLSSYFSDYQDGRLEIPRITYENSREFMDGLNKNKKSQIFLLLMVSSLAIILIATARLLTMQGFFATKMMLGSSRKQIIFDAMMETWLFMLIAGLVDVLLIYLLKRYITTILVLYFSPRFFLASFLFLSILAMIIGGISSVYATRGTNMDMLHEGAGR